MKSKPSFGIKKEPKFLYVRGLHQGKEKTERKNVLKNYKKNKEVNLTP